MPKQDRIYAIMTNGAAAYNNNQATRDAVFDKLIEWYFKHECFHGANIIQHDEPNMDAPNILAEIADDLLKFDIKWDE